MLKLTDKTSFSPELFFTLLLAAALTMPWIAVKPFYTKGEPREALTAQAMLSTGNWVLPKRYSGEIATKPPLSHWLMALTSLFCGGQSEGTSRFPSALLSLVAVGVLFTFIRKRAGSRQAIATSALLITAVEWHRASLTARVDMVLSAFTVLGLLGLIRWEEKSLKGFPAATSLCFSAAVLTKGPVGFVLPALIFVLYLYLLRYRLKEIMGACLRVFCPALLIPALWYGAALVAGGREFLNVFISENFSRFAGTMQGGRNPHDHSAWYLYGTLLLGFLPWTLLFFIHLIYSRSRILPALHALPAALKDLIHSFEKYELFFALSLLCFVTFFSIPASKRSVYLLPAYPFGAYFAAVYLNFLFERRKKVLCAFAGAVFSTALLFYLILAALYFDLFDFGFLAPGSTSQPEISFFTGVLSKGLNPLSMGWLFFAVLSFGFCCNSFYTLKRGFTLNAFKASFAALVSVLLVLNGVVFPIVSKSLSPEDFAASIKKKVPANAGIYSYNKRFYALNYYLDGQLNDFNGPADLNKTYYVVMMKGHLSDFKEIWSKKFKVKVLASSNGYVIKPGRILILVKAEAA